MYKNLINNIVTFLPLNHRKKININTIITGLDNDELKIFDLTYLSILRIIKNIGRPLKFLFIQNKFIVQNNNDIIYLIDGENIIKLCTHKNIISIEFFHNRFFVSCSSTKLIVWNLNTYIKN